MRRLGIPSAALALAAGVASAGCADQTVAAQVGGETVTEGELIDEVEALAAVTAAQQTEGELEGSYSQDFVGAVLQNRIVVMLLERVLDEEEVEVNDQDRAEARQMIGQRAEAFAELPGWYQDRVVEDQALWSRFGELPPVEAEAAFFDLADRTDIDVSRRFGSWEPGRLNAALANQDRAVVPPEGPAPQPGGDGDGSGGPGGSGGSGGGQRPGPAESEGPAGSAGSAVE